MVYIGTREKNVLYWIYQNVIHLEMSEYITLEILECLYIEIKVSFTLVKYNILLRKYQNVFHLNKKNVNSCYFQEGNAVVI